MTYVIELVQTRTTMGIMHVLVFLYNAVREASKCRRSLISRRHPSNFRLLPNNR